LQQQWEKQEVFDIYILLASTMIYTNNRDGSYKNRFTGVVAFDTEKATYKLELIICIKRI